MKSREIAALLIDYWKSHPGIGHTRTILDGAGKTNATVVVATQDEKERRYRNVSARKVITLEDVAGGALNAREGFPLVIDNGALVVLLNDLLKVLPAKSVKKEKTS